MFGRKIGRSMRTRHARLMSSDGPCSGAGALNVPGGNLVRVHVRRSCAQKREACPRVSVGRLLMRRRRLVATPDRSRSIFVVDSDLLEACPRARSCSAAPCLTRWRVHPCSSIGWTNPPSELDLRGSRQEPSRPHVQACASRVCLSMSLLDAGCISTPRTRASQSGCPGLTRCTSPELGRVTAAT